MERTVRNPAKESGLTLLELLIAVSILGIIVSVGVPSMNDATDAQRLVGAAEQISSHIQQARSESIVSSTPVFVNFDVDNPATTTWTYGISDSNSLCDLSLVNPVTANACVLVVDDGDGNVDPGDGSVDTDDLVLSRFPNDPLETIAVGTAGFSSGNTQIEFDPVRGMSTAGAINLTSARGKLLRVEVSLLGRIGICSPDGSIPNYKTC